MSVGRACALLLALALVLCGVLFALLAGGSRPSGEPEAAKTAQTEQESVMITDVSVGSLAAAALSSGGKNAALMIEGDQVVLLDAQPGARISSQLLKAFLYRMAHMPAERVLGEIGDPAEYGFDAYTAAVALLFADGGRIRLYLGSRAPFDAGWYLMREGDSALYLIDDMTAQMMRYTADDFRELDVFPEISPSNLAQVNRLTLINGENIIDIHGLAQDGAVYFYMAYPYDTLLSWERVVDAFVTPLAMLDKAAFVSADVPPAKYGLAAGRAARLSAVIGGKETALLFAPADEEHYYCAREGGSDVVLVEKEKAAFLNTQAMDLMDATLYTRAAADVERVQVRAQGVSGELAISGSGTMLRGRIAGRTLGQAETVELYDVLTMLPPAQELEKGQAISGRALLEMTFSLRDGSLDTVSLIPVSERRCAVVINGEAAFATYTATAMEIIRVCQRAFGG